MKATEVSDLFAKLATREPTGYRLGTPVLDTAAPEFRRLVDLGSAVVPDIVAQLLSAPARKAAWMLAALGQIGDPRALPTVRECCARSDAREPTGEWDYAVRGQCRLVLETLAGK